MNKLSENYPISNPVVDLPSSKDVFDNFDIAVKIFYHLSVDELAASELVCRKWHHIISHECVEVLSQPRVSLIPRLHKESKLFNRYNFVFKNVEDVTDANFYLVGELHGNESLKKLFGQLVTRLGASHNLIVLIEGTPSMQIITKNIDALFSHLNISSIFKGRIIFLGWDAKDLEVKTGRGYGLSDAFLLKQADEFMMMYETVKNQIEELNLNLKGPSGIDREVALQIVEKYALLSKIREYHKEILDLLDEKPATTESLKQTFPERTASMVDTLKQLQAQIDSGEFVGKVVLLAGAAHLETDEKDTGVEEFNLASLYQTLNELKAVVMVPHIVYEERRKNEIELAAIKQELAAMKEQKLQEEKNLSA